MNKMMVAFALAGLAAMPAMAAMQQPAQTKQAPTPRTVQGTLTLYEMTNYNGDTVEIDQARSTVHTDWNIHSISVHPGDRWQLCTGARFREPCIILNRSIPDAEMIGLQGQIGSARPAPEPGAASGN